MSIEGFFSSRFMASFPAFHGPDTSSAQFWSTLRGRAAKSYRHSATNGTRSCAHPAAAAWPPSHSKTVQGGIAASGPSRNQKKEENDCCRSSQKTTLLGKNSSENPQEGVTGLNSIQKNTATIQ
jgi:hypothetical protein